MRLIDIVGRIVARLKPGGQDFHQAEKTDGKLLLERLTINALTASDKTLVVVSPGYFELDSIV